MAAQRVRYTMAVHYPRPREGSTGAGGTAGGGRGFLGRLRASVSCGRAAETPLFMARYGGGGGHWYEVRTIRDECGKHCSAANRVLIHTHWVHSRRNADICSGAQRHDGISCVFCSLLTNLLPRVGCLDPSIQASILAFLVNVVLLVDRAPLPGSCKPTYQRINKTTKVEGKRKKY